MKRLAVWMMCVVLLLGLTTALADSTEKEYTGELTVPHRFTVKWIVPEDYEMAGVDAGGSEWIGDPGFMIGALVPKDVGSGKPMVNFSIARNAQLSGVERLNDLDQAALNEIEAFHRDENTQELSYMETSNGTRILVVRETIEVGDYVEFYTIYKGYEIKMTVGRVEAMDATPINNEEINMVMQFLSDMYFEPERE